MESNEKTHTLEEKKFPQNIWSRRVVACYSEIRYLANNVPSANTLAWSRQSPFTNISVSVLLAQFQNKTLTKHTRAQLKNQVMIWKTYRISQNCACNSKIFFCVSSQNCFTKHYTILSQATRIFHSYPHISCEVQCKTYNVVVQLSTNIQFKVRGEKKREDA